MDQLQNNNKKDAMLGQFPESFNKAVIESKGVHEKMALKVLSNDMIAKGVASAVYDALIKGLSDNPNT